MIAAAGWAAESAPVTDWGPRLLLTGTVALIIALAIWGMLRGWRGRQARQAALPQPPSAPPSASAIADTAAVPGLYVATTTAGDLLDRIVVHGLGHRGRASLAVSADGVLISRVGEVDLWIPRDGLRQVRLGSGQAQKAFEAGGVILIEWQLGDRAVETGFRADDPEQHTATARDLSTLVLTQGDPR